MKPFPCPYCTARFNSEAARETHEKQQHPRGEGQVMGAGERAEHCRRKARFNASASFIAGFCATLYLPLAAWMIAQGLTLQALIVIASAALLASAGVSFRYSANRWSEAAESWEQME